MDNASFTTLRWGPEAMSMPLTKFDSSDSRPSSNVTISPEALRHIAELTQIGREAVREAQEESRRLGVPNVYTINGIIHYELPDGSLTTEDPYPAMQAARQQLAAGLPAVPPARPQGS